VAPTRDVYFGGLGVGANCSPRIDRCQPLTAWAVDDYWTSGQLALCLWRKLAPDWLRGNLGVEGHALAMWGGQSEAQRSIRSLTDSCQNEKGPSGSRGQAVWGNGKGEGLSDHWWLTRTRTPAELIFGKHPAPPWMASGVGAIGNPHSVAELSATFCLVSSFSQSEGVMFALASHCYSFTQCAVSLQIG
jgi:hypothetical protein